MHLSFSCVFPVFVKENYILEYMIISVYRTGCLPDHQLKGRSYIYHCITGVDGMIKLGGTD